MKRRLMFCLPVLLIMLAVAQLPAHGQNDLQRRIKTFRNSKHFEVKYDRFKDETRVSVGPSYPGRKVIMEARFYFKGQQPTQKVAEVYLVLTAYGTDWQFLNTRTLNAIIDGDRV